MKFLIGFFYFLIKTKSVMLNEESLNRINLIYRIFFIIAIFFIIKLIDIQIIKYTYYLNIAEKNRTRVISKTGPRGNIITSNGEVVATNKTSYSLMFFPSEKMDDLYIEKIAKSISSLMSVDYGSILSNLKRSARILKPLKIVENFSIKTAIYFYELKSLYPELEIIEENLRFYPYKNMLSHIIGYIGKMDKKEWEYYSTKNYSFDAMVGKVGVEKRYEEFLKGKNGGLFMEVDNRGRVVRLLGYQKWEKGNDVVLTINYNLQKAAEDFLEKLPYKRGTAICVDSTNGKILVYAVKPGYDLNYFTSYRDEKTVQEIDEFNIPVSGVYPPASTFKIITAIAGLETNKIKEETIYYCPGYFDAGNRIFKCWEKKGHGKINLVDAIANSCDVYFYNVGLEVGPYELENIAKKFRLNEKTGIDLPYEKKGNIFGPKSRIGGKGYWFIGDTLNMAIGQGETLVTPIGILQMVMALSNGGYVYKPYYVEKVVSENGKVIFENNPQLISKVELKKETMEIIKKSMRKVVTYGTGKACNVEGVEVYGKTGTAQNPHGKDHAWFIAFAYKEGFNPIAISVFIEHGEHGSSAAAPVAREIIMAYFNIKQNFKDEQLEIIE